MPIHHNRTTREHLAECDPFQISDALPWSSIVSDALPWSIVSDALPWSIKAVVCWSSTRLHNYRNHFNWCCYFCCCCCRCCLRFMSLLELASSTRISLPTFYALQPVIRREEEKHRRLLITGESLEWHPDDSDLSLPNHHLSIDTEELTYPYVHCLAVTLLMLLLLTSSALRTFPCRLKHDGKLAQGYHTGTLCHLQ